MKKTLFTLTANGSGVYKFMSVLLFTLAFVVCAKAQIIYTPSEAIEVIESLNVNDPLQQNPTGLSQVNSNANRPASLLQATEADMLASTRGTYYRTLIGALEEESSHNNTIAGTEAVLQEVYNALLPDDTNNLRYQRLVQINNELIARLQKG